MVRGLFSRAWDALSATDLLNPSGAWEKIRAIFGAPIRRLVDFAIAAGRKLLEFIFEGALALAGGAGQRILGIFRRIGETFSLIVADPLAFLRNLINAVKGGFQRFVANIWTHLKTALFQWLTGALGPITLPARWDLMGIIDVILQILGLTYARMREKLIKLIGEPAVKAIETAFEFIKTIVTGGLAAAWEKLVEFASGLVDTVIGGIRDWVARSVVGAAVTKLVTMFNPVGAVIQGIITIYNTVMFFVERAQQIGALLESIVDSISTIARGNIGGAIDYVERTLARTLPVIISFLARLIGLGNISGTVRGIIAKIQNTVSNAIDKVIGFVIERARSLFAGRQGAAASTGDLRDVAGALVAKRAAGARTAPEINQVVAQVHEELRPQGLRRLAFEPPDQNGDSVLIAQASTPKPVGAMKPKAPPIPSRTVVLRATLTFESDAVQAMGIVHGQALKFFTENLPRPRRGDIGAGPVGLQAAAALVPPTGQGRAGAFAVRSTGQSITVVAHNSGDPAYLQNTSHAEHFLYQGLRQGIALGRAGLKEITININLSPCKDCAADLIRLISSVPGVTANLRYVTPYVGYDKGLPRTVKLNSTTTDTLAALDAGGWKNITGPVPKFDDAGLERERKASISIYTKS